MLYHVFFSSKILRNFNSKIFSNLTVRQKEMDSALSSHSQSIFLNCLCVRYGGKTHSVTWSLWIDLQSWCFWYKENIVCTLPFTWAFVASAAVSSSSEFVTEYTDIGGTDRRNCKLGSFLQFSSHWFQTKNCTIQHFKRSFYNNRKIGNILIQGPYHLQKAKLGTEDWQISAHNVLVCHSFALRNFDQILPETGSDLSPYQFSQKTPPKLDCMKI